MLISEMGQTKKYVRKKKMQWNELTAVQTFDRVEQGNKVKHGVIPACNITG